MAAISQARAQVEQLKPDDDPTWLDWLDPAAIAQASVHHIRSSHVMHWPFESADTSAWMAAISQARAQVEQLKPDDDPTWLDWLDWLDPAAIAVSAGDCLLQVGQADPAAALLNAGITEFSESFIRDRQIHVTRPR